MRPTNRAQSTFERRGGHPHSISAEQLCARLASAAEGLTQKEASARLEHEGPNVLSEEHRSSLLVRLVRHLTDRFALLLWVGAALAFAAERFSPGEGMALIAAALSITVVINGAFSFWQELRVERAMAAFREMLARRARVLRDRVEREIWRTTRQSVIAKGLLGNRAVLLGIAVECLLLLVVVETNIGRRLFGTAPAPLVAWLIPATVALIMLALSETLKTLKRAPSPARATPESTG